MELNSLTNNDFTSLIDIIWIDNVNEVDKSCYSSGIFNIFPIPLGTGEHRRFSEFDREEYAKRKAQGNQAERLKTQQGYTKDMDVFRYGEDVGVTIEDIQYNKYPEVMDRLINMVDLPWNRMELDMQQRLSNFDQTSFVNMDGETIDLTTGDTFAWAYTAHTVKGTASTYRNILANNPRLSKGSLIAILRQGKENAINQFGEKLPGIRYDILWTTDDEEDMVLAEEYLESLGAPDFNNPAVKNVMRYKFRHVILPRVAVDANGLVDTTKRHFWGVSSSKYTAAYIGIWEAPFAIPMYDLPDGSENKQTGVRAAWGITVVTGRGNQFSRGDGTP